MKPLFLRLLPPALLLAVFASTATAGPLFDAAFLKFDTGPGPHTEATADFDGDGKPDLVVANGPDSSISVLLNQGEGRFAPPRDQACMGQPGSIATGDVNGDQKPDVAVTYPSGTNVGSNRVSLFIGSGDGGFAYGLVFAVPVGVHSVAVGDLNGDAVADFVVSNEHSISAFLGATSGIIVSTGEFTIRAVPNSNYPVAVALGDLNGDGATDVALAVNEISDRPCTVLLGHGDGTFGSPAQYGTGNLATSITTADVNADGHADLVLGLQVVLSGTSYQALAVLRGDGSGVFLYQSYFLTGLRVTSIALADVNGDGKRDAAVATDSSSAASVMLGDGLGGFAPRGRLERGYGTSSVVAADWNGDGKLDLAACDAWYGGGGVAVSLGNGNGTFGGDRHEIAVGADPRGVTLADFDGEGHLDVAVANGNSSVSIALGNGDGSFDPSVSYAVPGATSGVAVGDVNVDGIPDLAVLSGAANKASVWLGLGNGAFGPRNDYDTGIGFNPSTGIPYVAGTGIVLRDIDHDGRADLIVASRGQGQHGSTTPGIVAVFLAQPDGTMGQRRDLGTGYGTQSLAVGNLDSDIHPDIAVVNTLDGTVAVYWGNGLGDFGGPTDFGLGGSPRAIAAGDVNLDGRLDLVVTGSTLTAMLGRDDRSFDFVLTTAPAFGKVAIGDLDNDRIPDLAIASNGVWVMLGDGDGTFVPDLDYGMESGASDVAIGDINGDRRRDLAASGSGYALATVLLNIGQGVPTSTPKPPVESAALEFALRAVSPNPTTGSARLEYTIATETYVRLAIVDVQGRTVARLVDRVERAGRHVAAWDGTSTGRALPPGVYLASLEAGGYRVARSIAITR